MRRRALITFASLALVAGGYACGDGKDGVTSSPAEDGGGKTTGQPDKTVATVPVGQGLTVVEDILGTKSGVVITVTSVKAGVKSGNQFVTPAKGQFVVAEVTATVQQGKVSISWANFKLVGADGTVYETTVMGDGMLSGNDLTAGQKTSGKVAFDAAVGAEKGGKIAVKSWLADGDAGYWTLP